VVPHAVIFTSTRATDGTGPSGLNARPAFLLPTPPARCWKELGGFDEDSVRYGPKDIRPFNIEPCRPMGAVVRPASRRGHEPQGRETDKRCSPRRTRGTGRGENLRFVLKHPGAAARALAVYCPQRERVARIWTLSLSARRPGERSRSRLTSNAKTARSSPKWNREPLGRVRTLRLRA